LFLFVFEFNSLSSAGWSCFSLVLDGISKKSIRILERAASLAWAHSLRANDAIHLAGALAWRDMAGDEALIACYNQNLGKADRREGLQVCPG
jgi:hypothetical protein